MYVCIFKTRNHSHPSSCIQLQEYKVAMERSMKDEKRIRKPVSSWFSGHYNKWDTVWL